MGKGEKKMSEICIKKELEYSVGLFRICAVVLEAEAEDDFMLHFKKKGSQGVHTGKKHFRSILEAETYISMLVINGFSVTDL